MWASHFVINGNKLSISSWLTTEVQICQNMGRPNPRPPNLVLGSLVLEALISLCVGWVILIMGYFIYKTEMIKLFSVLTFVSVLTLAGSTSVTEGAVS